MRLDATDRSRMVFACLLTAVALPAIWWANQDDADSGRPNVAAVGVPAADGSTDTVATTSTAVTDPAYLTPVSTLVAPTATPPSVQVGSSDHRLLGEASGTYRRDVAGGRCEVSAVDADGTITVYNPANGQSIECRVQPGGAPAPTIVLSPTDFDALADFIDAPVPLELRDSTGR